VESEKAESGNGTMTWLRIVAQIGSLLYRGLSIRGRKMSLR
jgi:hypothetical protein